MNNWPRILLATPTADVKDYCIREWSYYVKHLTYPNLEILIVDNSIDPTYWKKIKSLGLPVVHYQPKKEDSINRTLLECNNICRDYFLKGEYDFFFSLESDIFSGVNVIEHLLSFQKWVVGIPYFISQAYQSQYMSFITEDFGYIADSVPMTADQGFNFVDGTCKRTHELGLGAILIARWVIDMVPFRLDESIDGAPDLFLHEDYHKKGIPVFVDTSTMAFHQNSNWNKVRAKHNERISKL